MSDSSNFLSVPLILGVFAVLYVVFAYPFYVMGQKTSSEHPWFAFVPILNVVLMLEIGGLELWYIVLFFIPCVNIIVSVYAWMKVAEAMEKPSWVGLLSLVPFVNLVLPFYLAFA